MVIEKFKLINLKNPLKIIDPNTKLDIKKNFLFLKIKLFRNATFLANDFKIKCPKYVIEIK